MTFATLADAEFISIETFRRNGEGVRTPTWQTPEDGKLYVWTMAGSGKVKRIRRNEAVRICRCDMAGNPLGDWVDAKARVLDSEAEIAQQRERMLAKYGERFSQFGGAGGDRVVVEIRPSA